MYLVTTKSLEAKGVICNASYMGRPKIPSKTALFEAAKRWDVTAVKTILLAAPDLAKASDVRGRRALHMACAVNPRSGSRGEPHGIKTVTAILKADADLEIEVPMNEDEGDFRATALWYAVARGENLPLVRFLLSCDADPSYSLWAVVWRDDGVMCRHLLEAKPRLNLRGGPDSETPIFYAARLKRLKTLELLIKAGADPCVRDVRGRDALDIARARRVPQKFIGLLTSAMPQVSA